MEYMWYSVLRRTDDFYERLPKYIIKMIDIYKKMNNIKDEEVEEERGTILV